MEGKVRGSINLCKQVMSDNDATSRRREWTVEGRVQGVAFRAATRRKALELGLHGKATNLVNGCVHVVARGDNGALDALDRWLQHGPPQARVVQLHRLPESAWTSDPSIIHDGFGTR